MEAISSVYYYPTGVICAAYEPFRQRGLGLLPFELFTETHGCREILDNVSGVFHAFSCLSWCFYAQALFYCRKKAKHKGLSHNSLKKGAGVNIDGLSLLKEHYNKDFIPHRSWLVADTPATTSA
ncbi:hypothetical protein OK016_05340 [Vibrio chagasii]|nr:hypothetical protein [Vibrio chagasii]